MSKLEYKWPNIVRGGIIYAVGDGIAALILDEFTLWRVLGVMALGATVYAFEIPNYFRWIDKVTGKQVMGYRGATKRAALALLYFNPIWIFRHLFFIQLFMGNADAFNWGLLYIAFWSFVVNIPVSFAANYLIQNKVKLRFRFLASAVFSALMAVYYALSTVLFV